MIVLVVVIDVVAVIMGGGLRLRLDLILLVVVLLLLGSECFHFYMIVLALFHLQLSIVSAVGCIATCFLILQTKPWTTC